MQSRLQRLPIVLAAEPEPIAGIAPDRPRKRPGDPGTLSAR
jgi:hypothetical protein